jgi:hypothetical protein
MRYRKPFTPEQRQRAIREYDSFRNHVRLMRSKFPPRVKGEINVLNAYKRHVRLIGQELLKMNPQVNVAELNAQLDLARSRMSEYFRVRFFRG